MNELITKISTDYDNFLNKENYYTEISQEALVKYFGKVYSKDIVDARNAMCNLLVADNRASEAKVVEYVVDKSFDLSNDDRIKLKSLEIQFDKLVNSFDSIEEELTNIKFTSIQTGDRI